MLDNKVITLDALIKSLCSISKANVLKHKDPYIFQTVQRSIDGTPLSVHTHLVEFDSKSAYNQHDPNICCVASQMIPHTLGERLKRVREAAGFSQHDLARLMNISHSTLSHYENNKITPSIDNLIRLSNFFNVSLDYLVKGEPTLLNTLHMF